jgi:hypothetical protein
MTEEKLRTVSRLNVNAIAELNTTTSTGGINKASTGTATRAKPKPLNERSTVAANTAIQIVNSSDQSI